MRIFKAIGVFILLLFFLNSLFSQRWKQYSDSAKTLGIQNMSKAIELYSKAKEELKKDSLWTNTYAELCNNLGNLYSDVGQFEKAEQQYIDALQIREKVLGRNNVDYARSCNNLGILYSQTGSYEKVEPLYLEAREIRKNILGKSSADYAGSCNNLGLFYRLIGQFEKSESLLLEARQIWEKVRGKEHPTYASNSYNLALLYEDLKQYRKAEQLYLEAKDIREKTIGKDHPDYAASCSSLGRIYRTTGEFEKAEPLLLEAKQIREKILGKDRSEYAASCIDLGKLYWQTRQYEKAEQLYLEAKQIWEKVLGKKHYMYTISCRSLANLYWSMNKPEQAHNLFAEAFASQNNQVNNIFQFTSEREKQFYIKTTTDLEHNYFSFITSTSVGPDTIKGFSYDIALSHRNLILSSSKQMRQLIYASTDTSIKDKFNDWIELREQLSFWSTKPFHNRPAYIDSLEDRANALEKELNRFSTAFKMGRTQNNISWKDVQKQLKPNEAAIEFIAFTFYNVNHWTDSIYYIALVLTRNLQEPQVVPLFEGRQLTKLIRSGNSLHTIATLYTQTDKENLVYNLIWLPIERQLKDITKVYFAPTGILYQIAFHALPISEQQLLSDQYQLIQLTSTASLVSQNESLIDSLDRIYLYGGIQYDVDSIVLKQAVVAYHNSNNPEMTPFLSADINRGSTWKYLPGTEKEIREIESLGRQKNYTLVLSSGAFASEESIKALNDSSSPAVLHIATHGFFFPDPRDEKTGLPEGRSASGNVFRQSDDPLFRSGLLFAGANNAWQGKPVEGVEDGILTAYEVSNLYLPNTKLVVLSACETGLGKIQGNEGVYGLQRAFKIAGVENLIMSLWKIPDQVAAEFMQEYYREIFNKQSVQDAFYKAQTVMKNRYRKEPYKWAAWVLVR